MVDRVPDFVLAPFLARVDPESNTATFEIPKAIAERLEKPAFTESAITRQDAPPGKIPLIEVSSLADNEEVSLDKLIDQMFGPGNAEWTKRKEEAMKKKGFIQDTSDWVEESTNEFGQRSSRDELFTVKVDNLPEGMGQNELWGALDALGCDYIERVVVMKQDNGEYKRWAYVKFRRLRWAVKFVEDYQKARLDGERGGMIINCQLVP